MRSHDPNTTVWHWQAKKWMCFVGLCTLFWDYAHPRPHVGRAPTIGCKHHKTSHWSTSRCQALHSATLFAVTTSLTVSWCCWNACTAQHSTEIVNKNNHRQQSLHRAKSRLAANSCALVTSAVSSTHQLRCGNYRGPG